MYRACKSYSEQSLCVSELVEAALALKRELGYSEADARSVALGNIASIARAGQITLNLLDSWTTGNELVRQVIPQLIGLTTVMPSAVQAAGDILGKSSKLALGVLAQFQIENVLRNVGRDLGVVSPSPAFYQHAAALLQFLGMPQDRIEVINTPARIRNSLHSNGIHRRMHPAEATEVTIKGVRYEFIDGQRVACASWEHIAHALEASVEVLGEVFRHPKVMAIADPMMDQYAWEMDTQPTSVRIPPLTK